MQQNDASTNADLQRLGGDNPGHCPSCSRPAAASRPQCLYCGEMLRAAGEPASALVGSRSAPDLSAQGYTLFLTTVGDRTDASDILGIDDELLFPLLLEPGMPVARTADLPEAELAASALGQSGFDCRIIADAEFQTGRPNTRLSALEFDGPTLIVTNFSTKERSMVRVADVALLVEGTIARSRTDSILNGRKASSKTLSETVTSADAPVLDFYTKTASIGFRIVPSGFDFSVLGDRKRLTAAENWRTLVEVVSVRMPDAHIDRRYTRLRRSLDLVWPPETESASTDRVISGLGRRNFGSVSTVSNLKQFDMYSRSRRYFL